MFKKGQRLICIESTHFKLYPNIVMGEIYTVAKDQSMSMHVVLEEMDGNELERSFSINNFKLADLTTQAIITPSSSSSRKSKPLFSGCMNYFPDALLAVAEHSRKANDKHNPGEKLHWSKNKSADHADCAARHLLDIGPDWNSIDPEFDSYHATALAWRALALLQTVIEREKEKK